MGWPSCSVRSNNGVKFVPLSEIDVYEGDLESVLDAVPSSREERGVLICSLEKGERPYSQQGVFSVYSDVEGGKNNVYVGSICSSGGRIPEDRIFCYGGVIANDPALPI